MIPTRTLLLILIIPVALVSAKPKTPFRILSAETQDWISGAPGGRSGTTYSISLKITSSATVEFTSLWIGADQASFTIERADNKVSSDVRRGDTLILFYNRIFGESQPTNAPPYKGEALIAYIVKGKKGFAVVRQFRRLEPLRGR